jgi:hypothetical protein
MDVHLRTVKLLTFKKRSENPTNGLLAVVKQIQQ